jgi:hypothetical protein
MKEKEKEKRKRCDAQRKQVWLANETHAKFMVIKKMYEQALGAETTHDAFVGFLLGLLLATPDEPDKSVQLPPIDPGQVKHGSLKAIAVIQPQVGLPPHRKVHAATSHPPRETKAASTIPEFGEGKVDTDEKEDKEQDVLSIFREFEVDTLVKMPWVTKKSGTVGLEALAKRMGVRLYDGKGKERKRRVKEDVAADIIASVNDSGSEDEPGKLDVDSSDSSDEDGPSQPPPLTKQQNFEKLRTALEKEEATHSVDEDKKHYFEQQDRDYEKFQHPPLEQDATFASILGSMVTFVCTVQAFTHVVESGLCPLHNAPRKVHKHYSDGVTMKFVIGCDHPGCKREVCSFAVCSFVFHLTCT